MKHTTYLISSMLIACLIGQTYQQASCTLTPSSIDAGSDTNFDISLTAASGTAGWGRENFPQAGLLCTGTAGFAVDGQQSCQVVQQANNIQVNVNNVAASQSAITVQLHHMRNPFGQADPVICELMPSTGTTAQFTASAGLTSIGFGNLVDLNVAVTRILTNSAETLVLSPNIQNFTQSGQPIEINLPRAIKTPPTTFYPYDIQVIHTDALGKTISTSQKSYNPAFLIATQAAQLNSTQQFGDTNTAPGAVAKYQFFIKTNLPLCKDCLIGVFHQGLTLTTVTIDKDTNFAPTLTVQSSNSSVILLKSDNFYPKLDQGSFTIGGITNPQTKGNALKIVIFDGGMNAISASQQPLLLVPAAASGATGSCKIMAVDQSNAIGSTGKMRIQYKPVDTTNSTGTIVLKFIGSMWPVSSTMPKVLPNLTQLQPGTPGFDPNFPAFFPNSTVTTKFPVATTYEVDINNIQNSFSFVFELQNMVNPLSISYDLSTIFGTCQILDKSGTLKDTTNLVADVANLWTPPQLNANFTPSIPLKNGQAFDANFTLALTKGVPASGYFQITLPNRNAIYSATPNSASPASYISGCTNVASCSAPTVQIQSLSSSTAAPVTLQTSYPSTGVIKAIYGGTTALVAGNYKLIIKQLLAPVSQAVKAEVGIVLYNSDDSVAATSAGAKDKPVMQSLNSSSFASASTVGFDTSASKNPLASSTYLFTLTTSNPIPSGGLLVVTLPPTFVINGALTLTKVDSTGFYTEDLANAAAVPPAQKSIKLTFNTFAPSGTQISFKLGGLKNPSAKVNNYTITTQDVPPAAQNNQPAPPANILDQGIFQINPVIDTSSNVCTLNSASPSSLGIQIDQNVFGPQSLAQWTIQYNPKDVAATAGIIQISLPIAKYQDVSNIACNSQNGGFQQGPGSSCTITKNATYTTIKIVGVIPFFQYTFTVSNITNPSMIIPATTGTDNIGYCQLFEASTNKLIDTTPFTMPTFTFDFLPDGPQVNFGNPINGGLTTISLNMYGAIGVFSTDKLYFEVPSRLANSGTNLPTSDTTNNATFITATSVVSLVQYKLTAPTSPTAPPTKTIVATFPCVVTPTAPTTYAGVTKYSLKPTFPAATTYIPPSPTTFYQLNITNVRLAPQTTSQNIVFKLLDTNNAVKVQKTTIPLISQPAPFQAPATKGFMVTTGGPQESSQIYQFNLNTSNPIPQSGSIQVDFTLCQALNIDSTSTLTVIAPTTSGLFTLTVNNLIAKLTVNQYIAAGTLISFKLDNIQNPSASYGNQINVKSYGIDGTSAIDTVDVYINPVPSESQCVLQSVSGPTPDAQVVGQPANIGFSFYTSTSAAVAGGKLVISISKKVFGVAPTTVTCSALTGFTTTSPACTLAYYTPPNSFNTQLLLTVTGTQAGAQSFDLTVKGMFNPTNPNPQSIYSVGTCSLYGTTTTALDTVDPLQIFTASWQYGQLSATVSSTNPSNGGLGDLSVTFFSQAPILSGSLVSITLDPVYKLYSSLPQLSSIIGLTDMNQPSISYKTPFSCSIGTTKYTPSQAYLQYVYTGFDYGDQLNIYIGTQNNIPSGAVCSFVLGKVIRNPISLKQGQGDPIGTAGTITLIDTNVAGPPQPYSFSGEFVIANQQPNFLNVTASMIGSTFPGASPVTYQFNVFVNNSLPNGGKLIFTIPQGVQYTPGNIQKDDTKFGTSTFDPQSQTITFPVIASIFIDPTLPPVAPITFIIDGFKNPQNLTGNVFYINTVDSTLNLIDRGSFTLNPVNPQPACIVQSADQVNAGSVSNYRIKFLLDKPLNQSGVSIIVTFNKALLPIFPDGTTQLVTCNAVSPTFTSTTASSTSIACTIGKNQTSGDGYVIIPALSQDQNGYDFIVKGLINPLSSQAITTFGQCSAISYNGQVIKSVPLMNNVVFQPATFAVKEIANSVQNIGEIIDAALTFQTPLAIQNGTTIILSIQRKTVDYIGKGITASTDSSIVNCTASACTPKITITSLICTNTALADTIIVPYQSIKVVTSFIAAQKYDNVTLIPSINTPIPAGYICAILLNGLLFNAVHLGQTNVLLTLNDAKGGIMAKDDLSYYAFLSPQVQFTGSIVTASSTPTNIAYTFTFKASNPIPIGGRISVGFNVFQSYNQVPKVVSSTPAGLKYIYVNNAGSGLITLNNTGSYITAGTSVTFVISGFQFFDPIAYTQNSFQLNTFLAADLDNDGQFNDMIQIDAGSIEINPVGPITIVSQAYVGTVYALTFSCPIDLNGELYNISLTYPTTVTFAPTTAVPCTYTGGLTETTSNTACIWNSATKTVVFPGIAGNTETSSANEEIVLNINNFTPAATTGTATGTISVVQGPQTICQKTFAINRS